MFPIHIKRSTVNTLKKVGLIVLFALFLLLCCFDGVDPQWKASHPFWSWLPTWIP